MLVYQPSALLKRGQMTGGRMRGGVERPGVASLQVETHAQDTPMPASLAAAPAPSPEKREVVGVSLAPSPWQVGMYGARGQVSRVLARLLWFHPEVELVAISSTLAKGQLFVTQDEGMPSLSVVSPDELPMSSLELLFLCSSDAGADQLLARCLEEDVRVIDLSRHLTPDLVQEEPPSWEEALEEDVAYGLTELFRERLSDAQMVFTPGGYSTCAGLALGPLAEAGQLGESTVMQNNTMPQLSEAMIPSEDLLHAELESALQETQALQAYEFKEALRASEMVRGASTEHPSLGRNRRALRLAFLTSPTQMDPDEVRALYSEWYTGDSFVRVLPEGQKADAASVMGTNRVDISIHGHNGAQDIVILSALDTLYKGAAGQAIQNMNEMLGLQETAGLHQKI